VSNPKPTPRNTSISVPTGRLVLGEIEQKVGELDQETRARVLSTNADTVLRIVMGLVIAGIFIGLNFGVMKLVWHAFDADLSMMEKFPQVFKPSDRAITANVFMSLIGATVVQVGVATIAIVSYLFPKRANGGAPDS
jgi:hypothetical protein